MKSLFYSILSVVFLLSCSGGSDKPTPPPVPTTISLNYSSAVLVKNQSRQLRATVTPYSLASWASSNPAVATVSSTGQVVAVSKGTAQITATAQGATAACEVVVPAGSPDYHWLVAGQDQGQAYVWTDRDTYPLGNGIAKCAAKSPDGTLFVAGESEGYPVLWIGDNLTKMPLSNDKGRANSVFLRGQDIYAVGVVKDIATYWKNETSTTLWQDPYPLSYNGVSYPDCTFIKSEAKAIAVDSKDYPLIVGSLWYKTNSNFPSEDTGERRAQWEPNDGLVNGRIQALSSNYGVCDSAVTCSVVDDDTFLWVGTSLQGIGVRTSLACLNYNGGSGSDYENYPLPLDVIPFTGFNSTPSMNNVVLMGTVSGIYKIERMPNRAYLDTYGPALDLNSFNDTLLLGYGYSKSIKLLGNDIYAAGRNLLWKDGVVLTTFSQTGEAYSLLVQ